MENWPNFRSSAEQTRQNEAALAVKLHLQREFGELRATYRWFSWKRLLIYLPGTILFLFFGAIFAWLGPTHLSGLTKFLFTAIMGGGLLIVGLWGIYRITAVLTNRTMIEITFDRLSVHHGPLPYPGNCSMHRSELKEIRMEETRKAGIPLVLPVEGGANWTPKASFHQLCVVLKDGRKFELLYGADENMIRYLEAAITEHLRLKHFSPTIITEVIPAGLQVQQEFGRLEVIYRWFSWKIMLLSLFATICFLGPAALLFVVRLGQPSPHEPPDIVVQLTPFALLLFALFGIYQSLVIALNRTTIEVSSERVCVHQGPLPYPGNRSVACSDLQRLDVIECEHKSDEPATYELVAILKEGQKIKVWSNASREILDYLKQAIEQQLTRQNLTLKP